VRVRLWFQAHPRWGSRTPWRGFDTKVDGATPVPHKSGRPTGRTLNIVPLERFFPAPPTGILPVPTGILGLPPITGILSLPPVTGILSLPPVTGILSLASSVLRGGAKFGSESESSSDSELSIVILR
jgi:hypothetical protein